MASTTETIDVLGLPVAARTYRSSAGWVTAVGPPMPGSVPGVRLSGKDFLEWQQTVRGVGDTAAEAGADFAEKIRAAATERHAAREAAALVPVRDQVKPSRRTRRPAER